MRVEQKWGFGMAPIKDSVQLSRQAAVKVAVSAIQGMDTQGDPSEALSIVKGLFSRAFRQDQWDWFTVWAQLGRPSSRLAADIAKALHRLRRSINNSEFAAIVESQRELKELDAVERLRKYPVSNSDLPTGLGYIYLLSTREWRNLLKIGYTNRSIEQRVKEINAATGVIVPFGVRAMWIVKDAPSVEAEIHALLDEYRVRRDREFFQLEYREAFSRIRDFVREQRLEPY
jgi:hypothetical protein